MKNLRKVGIIRFKSIDSTNNYAKANADSLFLPSVVVANEQTAGRGRHGNAFYSPKSTGLYMTLLIPKPESCELLTATAAVAVCKELEKIGIRPCIKWVNDIFVNQKKVCGILTEIFSSNEKDYAAVGIGINLTTKDFPLDVPNAGNIQKKCIKKHLAKRIANTVIDLLDENRPERIIGDYRSRLFILNKQIKYRKNNVEHCATVLDINSKCNLIVKLSNGETDILSSGEISIIL